MKGRSRDRPFGVPGVGSRKYRGLAQCAPAAKTEDMIGSLSGIVIDCPDPRALAPFYEALLGASRAYEDEEWISLDLGPGLPSLDLQRTDKFHAPDWTSGDPGQQLHLDVRVEDFEEGEAAVLAAGATLLEGSEDHPGFRVYADPVGHPFCLVRPRSDG